MKDFYVSKLSYPAKMFYFIFVVLLVMIPFKADAAKIIPTPQLVTQKSFHLKIDRDWIIATDTSDRKYTFCASWFKTRLQDNQHIVLDITDIQQVKSAKRIVIGNPKTNTRIAAIAKERHIVLPEVIGDQGYQIESFDGPSEEILVLANAPQGAFYGIQTLIQLVLGGEMKGISITDYPDHQLRAVDMGIAGSTKITDSQSRLTDVQKRTVDYLASLKINMLSQHCPQLFGTQKDKISVYKELADYCRERYIEFVPQIGSLRNTFGVPRDLVEGWWIRDEVFVINSDDFAIPEKSSMNLLGYSDSESVLKQGKWKIKGVVSIDRGNRFNDTNSFKLDSGQMYVKIPVEPNSHYHLTAYVKGESPVLSIAVINRQGKQQFVQTDYFPTARSKWTKSAVIVKTLDDTTSVMVGFHGREKPAWFRNMDMHRIDGALKNVIRKGTSDIRVTSLDGTRTYLLNTDYEIVDGRNSKVYSDDLASYIVKRISGGNIKQGQKVLISYDAQLYWSLNKSYNQPPCVSDEKLFTELYYPAIDKVISQLQPRIIHFLSDEIRGFNRDSRNVRRGLTNAQLFTEWITKIANYVNSKDATIRVMIWDDMISPFHNGNDPDFQLKYGGSKGRMAEAIEKDMIPKNIVLNSWWYDDRHYEKMKKSVEFYESKGFSYFGAPWNKSDNIQSWSALMLKKQKALGGYLTNWEKGDNALIPVFAECFWKTKGVPSSGR